MKKLYLKDMKREKQFEILIKNEKLLEQFREIYYNDMMEQQYEFTKNMLGNEYHKYIDVRDNYSSFYMVLKNWREFINNIDKVYLSDKELELYNYIMNKKEVLYTMDCYSTNYDNLDEHLYSKSEELLSLIEKELHTYEDLPDDEEVVNYMLDYCLLDDYYIYNDNDNDNDNKIYLDSVKVY